MFEGLTEKALAHVATVKSFVDSLDEQARAAASTDQSKIKAYAVSACVTRLYAVYEKYVETLLSDYLDALPELMPFAQLPDSVRKEYRIGFSSVLSKLDQRRYSRLSHENLVQWYSQALSGQEPYRLISHALIRHDDNLRLPTVEAMIARVGLGELRPWLSGHSEILALYELPEAVIENLEAELKGFVELRNDAAHGTIDDDLVGKDILHRYCAVVAALVSALSAFFHRSLLLERERAGKVHQIGTVTEVFRNAGACILQVSARRGVVKGMTVHVMGHNHCYSEVITSVRLDDEDVEGVSAIGEPLELGLQSKQVARRNAAFYVDVA